MTPEEFTIIQALCRCSMFNATQATIHQMDRLGKHLFANGDTAQAAMLYSIIHPNANDPQCAQLVQS